MTDNGNEPKAVTGLQLAEQVCNALGLDVGRVRHINIDIDVNAFISIEVEILGDERLHDIQWKRAKYHLVESEKANEVREDN
jgi:hypothetical protein